MKSYTDKNQTKRKSNVEGYSKQKQSVGAAVQLVDNRTAAIAQRKLTTTINNSPKQVAQQQQLNTLFGHAVQLQSMDEDELQMKTDTDPLQRMGEEEEELLQGQFETAQRQGDLEDEELLQGKFNTAQKQDNLEDEELLQGKFGVTPIQRQQDHTPNNTGLPDNLKAGIENLSGYSMDDVSVHFNSPKPAQVQAHAYAQGTDIHLASGQEKHLPHEAWHVVQQRQGRVQPTKNIAGVQVNDDEGLEREADLMGGRAVQAKGLMHGTRPDVVTQKKNNGIQDFGFVDNRPKAITQRKLQVDINSSQKVAQLEGWGEWMSHYWSKKDELGHVLTSGRRQFMQRTSAAAKTEREEEGTGRISLDKIRLLHWTEYDDESKTGRRRGRLMPLLESGERVITEDIINDTMGSKDLVQVAHQDGDEVYVTLEGVGRLLAIRTACDELEIPYRDVDVEVEKYTVTEETMESLLGVHQSYFENPESNDELDEDVWSHLYGVGRSLGWTIVGLGAVAALIVGGKKLVGGSVPSMPKQEV